MRCCISLIFIFFSYSISTYANKGPEYCYETIGNITSLDLSLEGCEYNADMVDAIISVPYSNNSINGIFGITVPSKIQEYEVSNIKEKTKHFSTILNYNTKYNWFKVTPIKKNNNFIDYYVYSPNLNDVTRIAAVGLMNKDLCLVTYDKIFNLFASKYKEFYKFQSEYTLGPEIKSTAYIPKKQIIIGEYYQSSTLGIGCEANEIFIRLEFKEFEEKILAQEERKLNSIKEEKYNNSYNKINVENILN